MDMTNDIKTFIQDFARRYDLSLLDMSRKLGYKSKTSLDRIINGNVRKESILKFEQMMRSAFRLEQKEALALKQAVQLALLGREDFALKNELLNFVQQNSELSGDQLIVYDSTCGKTIKLADKFSEADEVHVFIINCAFHKQIYGFLKSVLAKNESNTVEQYFSASGDDIQTFRRLNAVMPLLFERNYSCFVRYLKYSDDEVLHGSINSENVIIVEWTGKDAEKQTDMIILRDKETGLLLSVNEVDQTSRELLGIDPAEYETVKRTYFDYDKLEDYIRYSADYAALERNHAIWKIKPDIGVDQIPLEILKSAMLEGMPQDEAFPEPVLDALSEIYRKRYQNTYSKKRHAFTIFKRGAMHRFAITGRTSDHFWAMRPYTPEERIVILSDLLKQQTENPYVHMRFLKDDAMLRNIEVAYYDNEGILILQSDTDYDLDDKHSEAFITQKRALDTFKRFFMNTLMKEYVCSESETRAYLIELITEVHNLIG